MDAANAPLLDGRIAEMGLRFLASLPAAPPLSPLPSWLSGCRVSRRWHVANKLRAIARRGVAPVRSTGYVEAQREDQDVVPFYVHSSIPVATALVDNAPVVMPGIAFSV